MKLTTQNTLAASMIAAAGLFAGQASADALVYEGFNYTEGGFYEPHDAAKNLGGDTGWSATSWNAGNMNGIDVNPTSGQNYGVLPTSGLGATSAANLWGNRSRAIDSSLSDAGLLDDGATLWFSVLVRNTGGTDKLGFALANDDFSNSNQFDLNGGEGFGVFAQNGGNLQAVGWDTGVFTGFGSTAIDIDSTTLIVGELIWGATGADADTLNLYTPDTDLNQGSIITSTTQTLDQATFDRVSLLVKEGAFIDEIRFGATYGDVAPIPEPSSLALIGLGGLLIARRRRG